MERTRTAWCLVLTGLDEDPQPDISPQGDSVAMREENFNSHCAPAFHGNARNDQVKPFSRSLSGHCNGPSAEEAEKQDGNVNVLMDFDDYEQEVTVDSEHRS